MARENEVILFDFPFCQPKQISLREMLYGLFFCTITNSALGRVSLRKIFRL